MNLTFESLSLSSLKAKQLFEGEAEDYLLEDIRSGCTELTYIISSIFAESLRAHIIAASLSVEGLRNAKILQLTLGG